MRGLRAGKVKGVRSMEQGEVVRGGKRMGREWDGDRLTMYILAFIEDLFDM